MSAQPSLFDLPPLDLPLPVRRSDPATSTLAARAAKISGTSLRRRVLEAICEAGLEGVTDDELAQAIFDAYAPSVGKRRGELVDLGLVCSMGRTRPTRRGCLALVWQPVDGACDSIAA